MAAREAGLTQHPASTLTVPHAIPKGAGVRGSGLLAGVGGGHVGASAPSHPSYLPMLSGGEAASSGQETFCHTMAIGLDFTVPCLVFHFPRCSPDVPSSPGAVPTQLSSSGDGCNPSLQGSLRGG